MKSAPTENVIVSNLDSNDLSKNENISKNNFEQPIELNQEEYSSQNLYLKIHGFNSYNESKEILDSFSIDFQATIQNEGNYYSILIGPIENQDANNLVSSFISKGYKKTEILIF